MSYEPNDKLDIHYDVEGVGLIIFDKAKSIFALSKQDYWIQEKQQDRILISYGCVGGKIEQGETMIQAAIREAHEEIMTDIEIKSSKKTYLIDLKMSVRFLEQKWKINPIAIYFVKYPGKPGDPTKTSHSFIGKIYVFFAKLKGDPKPASEVPAILFTDWEIVQKNIGAYFPLSKFLKHGKIIEQVKIPENSLLYPMWTPEIIGKALNCQILKKLI